MTGEPLRLPVEFPPEVLEALAERAAELVREQAHDGSRWLDVDGAVRYLGWSKQRVYNHVGELPHRKHHGRLMFNTAELDEHLERFREGPARLRRVA